MIEEVCCLLKRLGDFFMHCRVYVGRRPADAPAPSLVLFPLLPERLACGFAGVMTFCLAGPEPETKADEDIAALWQKLAANPLARVVCGDISPADYLGGQTLSRELSTAVSKLKRADAQELLFFQPNRAQVLFSLIPAMTAFLGEEEKYLEDQGAAITSADLEIINSRLLWLKDIRWMLDKDILGNLDRVLSLCGAKVPAEVSPGAYRKYRKLNVLLNALDRLEVRGRDSAGIQLSFSLAGRAVLDDLLRRIGQAGLTEAYRQRTTPGDLRNLSIAVTAGPEGTPEWVTVTFVYKTFSIVGELGRNVAALRAIIRQDALFRLFADAEARFENALTHTRWASVGSITEENCHPVNNALTHASLAGYAGGETHISAVLNGDIDNYPALRTALEQQGDLIAPSVTTDTKIIPLQVEKYLKGGVALQEAFRLAVNDFEGSHAIALTSSLAPGKMFLALKGSGQSIYVGLSDDQCLFASELYGLVEAMPDFIKMNGETAGQIFILDANACGLQGIRALGYDGAPISLGPDALQTAEITTRDIDPAGFPHYFLKEISESSLSVKRTLRGKYRMDDNGAGGTRVEFNLGTDIIPSSLREGLLSGFIKNIVVIGHGTAAVAAQAVADAMAYYLREVNLVIAARIASELSGFGLKDDMSDTLVIPITQSGTTTDTNRAVAMVRERGAQIVSIVNRRQSDITAKSHGVFYTSDGRDVEMSVASTKAFYAQIVAGQVLALYFAQLLRAQSDEAVACGLRHLERAPELMNRIFSEREAIAASVKSAASKRYWAIVGSGPNKAAADEIRIKLSELCYKTISSDIVENKKHIDLSAEPLILVCAAGNGASVVEDVVKDVAIFKAHKSATVVFADEGDTRFDGIADSVISVPVAPHPLPVILNTMAGHLWGYYAARAIDEEARIFREFRGRLADEMLERTRQRLSIFDMIGDASLHRIINEFYALFNAHRQSGAFGALGGKTIADLLLLLKYTAGKLPLQDIRQDFRQEKDLFSPFDLLDATLGTAIDELTRPIDAIRHQAKTVTVGTSRKEKEIEGIIFDLMATLNYSVKHLTYRDVLTISRFQKAVDAVRGYTVYELSGLDEEGHPTPESMIVIRAKSGVSANIKSRADQPATLMGVKKTIVRTGHVYLGRGKIDGAPIMIIPLRQQETRISHLLLIHIRFNDAMSAADKIAALGHRYNDIRNLVNEYNLIWNDRCLDAVSTEILFSETIESIAERIKNILMTAETL